MTNTKLKRVIWLGNEFYDECHIIKNGIYISKPSNGGIRNCRIEGLENCYENYIYSCGRAHFLLSEQQQESAVDFRESWQVDEKSLQKYTAGADWLHIAYIDALPKLDLSQVDKTKFKVISCDFCHPKDELVSKKSVLANLECCDYIFDNETFARAVYHKEHIKKQTLVLHGPNGSIVQHKSQVYRCDFINTKKYIFTVGAGDRFAAAFIDARLKGYGITGSQDYAHESVDKWLVEVNESL